MSAFPAGAARGAGRAVAALAGSPLAWSRRRPRRAGVLAAVLAATLVAATATFLALHLRDESVAQARTEASDAATKAVPELMSYDHKNLAAESPSKVDLLTGPFKTDYATLLRDEVLPAAERSALVTTSTVVGHGVATADGPGRVTLLMFVNQSTGSAGAAPTPAASRISVTMEKVDERWLVSALKPV